ncbi:holo-ACP synthase [Pusillimonas sp. CC-YST705]|uniref:Holo-[acyl-carrier-protein] synthase n=1 Tax=Mesopusillimonas faecipullorum TaxID=2755040 RepID=A0ABS8CB86_9BURK|nr:holo-ACP synthase [Mesopusillimonas faecipullorum]MCB5363299.1 holo-ACP synthase [Mesopusillimonas faecipullorum]
MNLPGGLPAAIAGIGTDVVRVERIARAYERQGERFARRILGEQELEVFHGRLQRDASRGMRYLATRFAAKEAFSKAIGLGMHSPMSWPLMQTLNQAGGRPLVKLSDPLAQWCAERFGAAHVSLTDEFDLAMAFVVIEHKPAVRETPWAQA